MMPNIPSSINFHSGENSFPYGAGCEVGGKCLYWTAEPVSEYFHQTS